MHRSRNILRRTALSVCGRHRDRRHRAGASASQAQSAQIGAAMASTMTHATQLRAGDVIDGMVPFTQPIHIEVALKLRNTAELNGFIDSRRKSRRSEAQRTMAPDRVRRASLADRSSRHRPSRIS